MIEKKFLLPFEQFMPLDALEKRLEMPFRFLPEPLVDIIGSTTVAADGLTLSTIVLVTADYLVEVNLGVPQTSASFDYVRRNTIKNIRIDCSLLEIKEDDLTKDFYEIATISLIHSVGNGLVTTISYAGKNRLEWLDSAMKVFPVHLIE